MSERISSLPGIAFCFVIALPCWLLGKQIPVIGGPIFAILAGMVLAQLCHWGPGGRFFPAGDRIDDLDLSGHRLAVS